MGKRTKRSSTAELLESQPLNMAAARSPTAPTLSPPESPVEQFEFNLNGLTTSTSKLTSSKKKSCKNGCAAASASKMKQPTGIAAPSLKSVSTISDLKDLAASTKLESIKCRLDSSHSEIVKDMEASQFRLQKRLKLQKQAYQQVMDEAEKEYKMSERINEGRDAMKASYAEFLKAAQASAYRLLKTYIPDLSQSFEKSIDSLKSHYGISSTSA